MEDNDTGCDAKRAASPWKTNLVREGTENQGTWEQPKWDTRGTICISNVQLSFFFAIFCHHPIHRPVNQLFQLRVVCLAAASAFSARASSCPGPEGAEELA